VKVITKAISK